MPIIEGKGNLYITLDFPYYNNYGDNYYLNNGNEIKNMHITYNAYFF